MASTALNTAIILVLSYILLRCWKTFWVDRARHFLFCTRDDLFLYAADNGLVDHPAHRRLREIANAFIRYTHMVSLRRFLTLVFLEKLVPRKAPEALAVYQAALLSLPEEHQKKFEEFHLRMTVEVFRHIYSASLTLRLLLVLALPLFWLNGWPKRGAPPTKDRMDLLERDAFAKCAA